MELILPFPPSILRPNDRSHWRKKNPIKAAYRDLCESISLSRIPVLPEGNIPMSIVFYPPNNRWDWDAMVAAFKSGQDGMCQAWNINDKRIRPITIDFGQPSKLEPFVEINIGL